MFSSLGSGILSLRNSSDLPLGILGEKSTTQMNTLVFEGRRSQDSETYGGFQKIGGFPPKSSILIGFSIINHPFWGTPILGNPHIGIVALWGIFWFKKKQQLEVAAMKESGLQWNHLWLQPPSLWSLLAQIPYMLSTVSPFSRRENTSHIFWQRRQLELRITDPTHDPGPPGCLSTAQLSIPPLKAVSSDQPEQRKRNRLIFNKSPGVFGGRKNWFKAFHQLCHDSEIWGLLFFFSDVLFFCWGGGWGWKGANFRGFTPSIDSTKTSFRN